MTAGSSDKVTAWIVTERGYLRRPDRGATMNQLQRAEDFKALHNGPPFVIPNPWDNGSARVLEALGFKALATTSSAFAFTLGRLDGGVTLDELADHVEGLCDS